MSKFGFGAMAADWDNVKRQALQALAVDALSEFETNFDKQGTQNKKWKEVQRRIPGTRAYAQGDADDHARDILFGRSGQLSSNTQIGMVDSRSATVYNDTPYAQLHNEGGVNSNGGVVPARPFIMQTARLTTTQLATLRLITGEIWHKR